MDLAPLQTILDQHRATICARLVGMAEPHGDEAIRRVADYCYEFLPWPVRMAVKKPVFVDFVLAHREPVFARLSRPA